MPVPGRLLVGIADSDQNRLAPRPAQDLETGRQASAHEAHRDGHRRKPGWWGNAGAVVAVRRVEVADQPRRVVPRGIDQRVQFRLIHRRQHCPGETPPALLRHDAARIALWRRLGLRVAHPLFDRRMKFLRSQDLVEILYRRLRTKRSEISLEVVFEAVAEQVSERDLIDLGDVDAIDDFRPLTLHVDQRLFHQVEDPGIRVGLSEELSQHADARAAQSVPVEELQIAVGPLALARRGDGVRRIIARDNVENGDGIGHGPRHRPADVAVQEQRHDAGAAGQPHGRADADKARMGRRPADRIAGVGPEADRSEIGRHSGGRPAAGAGRDAVQRVRVARIAGQQRAHGLERAPGEFGHVGFGEHECARLAQLADLKGVTGRDRSLQRQRPRRGRHVGGIEIVLDDQRNAVQRPAEARLGKARVERIGGGQGVWVDHDDRVERRAFLVVRLDAVDIHLDQLMAGHLVRCKCCADVGDRRFFCPYQAKRTSFARVRRA